MGHLLCLPTAWCLFSVLGPHLSQSICSSALELQRSRMQSPWFWGLDFALGKVAVRWFLARYIVHFAQRCKPLPWPTMLCSNPVGMGFTQLNLLSDRSAGWKSRGRPSDLCLPSPLSVVFFDTSCCMFIGLAAVCSSVCLLEGHQSCQVIALPLWPRLTLILPWKPVSIHGHLGLGALTYAHL